MAKDGKLITAKLTHVPTGKVLATGEVSQCCAPHFANDVCGLVEEARGRMQEELSDNGGGGGRVGSTAVYRAGYDRIWGRGQVGEA